MVAVIGLALMAAPASAHADPEGCSANGVGISFSAFRADGVTPITGADSVQSGEEVKFQTTLSLLPEPNCSFGGGPTGSINITTPDGVVHNVVAPGNVPHVNDTNPSFVSPLQSYIVSEDDVDDTLTLTTDGELLASTEYDNGISHTGGVSDFDDEDHDSAGATAERNIDYEDVALEIRKDANPSFDREFLWDINKTVDNATHEMSSGESGDSTYTITLDQTDVVDTNHAVNGTITIVNPAEFADAEITGVSDVVSVGIVADVDCGVTFPFSLGPGETLECAYNATLPDDSTRTNNATVATSGDVDGNSTEVPVDFTGVEPTNVINEEVNIDDTNDLGDGGPFTGDAQYSYVVTFTCGEDEGEHPNTATIVETGQSDSASVEVICEEEEGQGCTPGFWKNHADLWHTYAPGDLVGDVFDIPAALSELEDDTLLEALNYRGGGGDIGMARNLLRSAVAAILNAEDPDVNYPFATADIIDDVNAALASEDRSTMEELKDELDEANNLGCGIDAHGNPVDPEDE